MRLFISWSGGRSHQLAMTFKNWLETHFSSQGINAFVSSEIEKGSQWLPAVDAELREADAGLVCLTARSLGSEWLSFEAGALATAVALRKGEPRVFTYLLGVKPESLPGPLAAYQSTVATMEDTLRLVNSLLSYLDLQKMSVDSFVDPWKDLWERLQAIEYELVTNLFPGVADLFDRKTFGEPIDQCTDQSWFQRYDGAVMTRNALRERCELVSAESDDQVADLYQELVAAVDGYAMDLSALLFEPRTFDLCDDGLRAVPPGVRTALERRRLAVHELVAQITDTAQQPRTREAVRFARSPAFATRKSMVHRIEQRLDAASGGPPDRLIGDFPQLLVSDWELDRIAAYLVGNRTIKDARAASDAVRREFDLVRANATSRLMPLYYSLRWLRSTAWRDDPQLAADVRNLAIAIEDLLAARHLDPGWQIRELLRDLRESAVTT